MPGIYQLRAYENPVDPTKPLDDEMQSFGLVANVVISGHVAKATLLQGKMPITGWADLDKKLATLGVTELHWERHKAGRVKRVVRKVVDA